MLVLATFLITNSVIIGGYTLDITGDTLEVSKGAYRSTVTDRVHLTALPVASRAGERLAIGHSGRLEIYDSNCNLVWAQGLEYVFNPGAMVAGADEILYYNGPEHLSRELYGTKESWVAGSRQHCLIEARSFDGRLLWKKPFLDVGAPVCYLGDNNFLTIRRSFPERGLDNIVVRIVDKDGSRKAGWVIPSKDMHSNRQVLDHLTSQNVLWSASGFKASARLEIREVRSVQELDLRAKASGLRATLLVSSTKLSLNVDSPSQIAVSGRPLN